MKIKLNNERSFTRLEVMIFIVLASLIVTLLIGVF